MQRSHTSNSLRFPRIHWSAVGLVMLALLYAAYLAFIVANQQSGVDYHTFVDIGQRFLDGKPVYVENSYYPLPYVLVFAALAALPAALSIFLWHSLPIVVALLAAQWRLWPLAFAPLFAHFVGGQTAIVALLAIYGYARWRDDWRGGAMLATATLKPQLVLLPLAWAGAHWLATSYREHRIDRQAWAFGLVSLLFYVPTFAIAPGWVSDWLASPRGLRERAMAGLVPRALVMLFGDGSLTWALIVVAIALFAVAAWRWRFSFEQFMFFGLTVNPFVHDYDLIQMLPLLNTPRLRAVTLLASVPTWGVILFAYGSDRAWTVVTLIPLLTALVAIDRRRASA